MKCCTFLGHRDCPTDIDDVLRETIIKLIKKENVRRFYVGNTGGFDRLVFRVLMEVENILYDEYLDIRKMLSYLPSENPNSGEYDFNGFVKDRYCFFPEGIESVPARFAIDYRNNYMLKNSQYVITYTVCNVGGAAKFEQKAIRQNKTVINIAKLMNEQKT